LDYHRINLKDKDRTLLNKQIKLLPLTTDQNIIGNVIKDITITNDFVSSVIINTKQSNKIDLIEKIGQENDILRKIKSNLEPTKFDSNYQFYLIDTNPAHILAVNNPNNSIIKKISIHFKWCTNRICYR
jgi:hypothetical protein